MSLSIPLVSLLLLGGFLAILGLLALAVTKVVAPNGQGHARGFLGGLAALFAVLFLGFLGLVGLGVYATAVGVATAIEENPIRSIEIQRGPGSFPDAQAETQEVPPGLQAFLSVEGNAGPRVAEYLGEILELDEAELDRHLRLEEHPAPENDVFELRFPVSESELEGLERDLQRELGLDVDLPQGIRVQLGRGE